MINTDALTVNGTVADRIANALDADGEIIHTFDNPFSKDGGIAVLGAILQKKAPLLKRVLLRPK